LANFGFSEITSDARAVLASHDIFVNDENEQPFVNLPDDTRVYKLAKGHYIYLIRLTHVLQMIEIYSSGTLKSTLMTVDDPDLHTSLRDLLLNIAPYVERPLI